VRPAEGRTGLTGLAGLFGDAAARLRASAALRRSLALWLAIGLAFTDGFDILLATARGDGLVPAVAGGLAWWALVAVVFLGGAAMLRTPDGVEVHRYGLPNGLTALRAWACLPLLLCAVWAYPHDLGFILWCSAGGSIGMLDLVDGWVARRFGPITDLGKAIDPAMDAFFFAVAAVTAVMLGVWPWWLTALTLFRYLGPLLLTPLVFLLGKRPELVHTHYGRRSTAATGFALFCCMWTRIFHGPVDLVALVLTVTLLLPFMGLHFVALWRRVSEAPRAV
jgi:phosphatidylglycerophosphate synthase